MGLKSQIKQTILMYFRNFKFEDVHVDGARRLAKVAKECGVERFIHVSALNAEDSPERKVFFPKTGSRFLQSKVRFRKIFFCSSIESKKKKPT